MPFLWLCITSNEVNLITDVLMHNMHITAPCFQDIDKLMEMCGENRSF